jgi:single-strand DNA-binding protein
MAGSVNKVILIGAVGADPEIRTTQAGKKIANFRMATNETWRDKDGNKQERASWHQICVFNEHLVPVIENYVKKGSRLYVEGSLQTRKYEKDGQERYTTEVVLQAFNGQLVLLGSPGDRKADAEPAQAPAKTAAPAGKTPPKKIDLDDSIPF